MSLNAPTTMSRFSISRHADKRKRNTGMEFFGAVYDVSWCQTLGEKDVSFSERWSEKAPNIYVAISTKK